MSASSQRADVVVIGAGPSGAIVTHTLATRGFKVTCLEQGDWVNPNEFPGNYPEWELLTQQQWSHDPNERGLPADYPMELSDSDMRPVMFNAVGGSTIFYGAEWPRLLPSDFRVRSLDGVADDWPISYDDLAPYYEEVDRFIGASGVDGDPAYPAGLTYPMPPLPIGKTGRRAAEGANKLGWHWWPGSNAIVSFKHKTLEPCARWGICEWGCPEGAKASSDLIYMPQALKAGAELITGARVRRIVTDRAGRASGVLWIDRDGNEQLQEGDAVVVCANGVGTPRLLLLSDGPAHPDGLANSSGLVGRNLMLHPNCAVLGYYDDDLESFRGPNGQHIYSLEFYETRPEHDFVRGAKLHVAMATGPMSAINAHHRLRPFDQVWGEPFLDVARKHARTICWAANTEDLPEESNRVEIDRSLVDSDGVPAPKIRYRISENTRRILKFTLDRARDLQEAAGAAETADAPLLIDQPGHLLGTARMGTDPARSVVDSYGRAHDVPNLFIADGSLMVTSGAANPTATICALALRVGQHIAETASRQSVPVGGGSLVD